MFSFSAKAVAASSLYAIASLSFLDVLSSPSVFAAAVSTHLRLDHRVPQWYQGRKEACCLDLPKPSLKGPVSPADYSSYTLHKSHTEQELFPVFDALLFNKCPTKKTDEEVCAAAHHKFGRKFTALYPNVSPYATVDGLSSPFAPSALDPFKRTFAKTTTTRKPKVLPLGKPKSTDAVFYRDAWRVDRRADLAIVERGCCFNLYPDAKPGDELSSGCMNPFIGSQALLSQLFHYSILTAGSVSQGGGNVQTAYSVIIGGTYGAASSDVEIRVAYTAVTDSGMWAGVAFGLGSSTTGSQSIISQNGGDIILAGTDCFNSVMGGYIPESKEWAIIQRKKIEAEVCSLSQSIAQLKASATAVWDFVSDPSSLTLSCFPGADPCVADVDSHLLSIVDTLVTDVADGALIKVNIRGRRFSDLSGLSVGTASATDTRVVLNFIETEVIVLPELDILDWFIVAPRAKRVEMQGSLKGAIMVGHQDSVIKILSAPEETLSILAPSSFPTCPVAEARVVLCDCLCAAKATEEKIPRKKSRPSIDQ